MIIKLGHFQIILYAGFLTIITHGHIPLYYIYIFQDFQYAIYYGLNVLIPIYDMHGGTAEYLLVPLVDGFQIRKWYLLLFGSGSLDNS